MKDKKCKNCLELFTPRKPLQYVCCYQCAISYSNYLKEVKMSNEWKKEKAVLKDKLKTLGQYEAEAKKSFQKWIRLRDEVLPCISCGQIKAQVWHGSHYFDANRYSGLIFNEFNVHKACNYCNVFLSGNLLEYRKGLIERYGIEKVENLESIANDNRVYKYTKAELIAKKLKYDILIKEMK